MPDRKNKKNQFQAIYVLVNIFLLITAPFNLGYYSYSLINELIPTPEGEKVPLIAGMIISRESNSDNTALINSETDNTVLLPSGQIDPGVVNPTLEPTILSTKPEVDNSGPKSRSNLTLYICIDDPALGSWSIFTPEEPVIDVMAQELAANTDPGLYCSSKIKIRNYDYHMTAVRIGSTTSEIIIPTNEIGFNDYLILRLDEASGQIAFDISNTRP